MHRKTYFENDAGHRVVVSGVDLSTTIGVGIEWHYDSCPYEIAIFTLDADYTLTEIVDNTEQRFEEVHQLNYEHGEWCRRLKNLGYVDITDALGLSA